MAYDLWYLWFRAVFQTNPTFSLLMVHYRFFWAARVNKQFADAQEVLLVPGPCGQCCFQRDLFATFGLVGASVWVIPVVTAFWAVENSNGCSAFGHVQNLEKPETRFLSWNPPPCPGKHFFFGRMRCWMKLDVKSSLSHMITNLSVKLCIHIII